MQIEDSTITLTIKWGKTTLAIDTSTSDTLEGLKAQLYSLTSVLPDKQKLMCKGKFLKDDAKPLRDIGLTAVR